MITPPPRYMNIWWNIKKSRQKRARLCAEGRLTSLPQSTERWRPPSPPVTERPRPSQRHCSAPTLLTMWDPAALASPGTSQQSGSLAPPQTYWVSLCDLTRATWSGKPTPCPALPGPPSSFPSLCYSWSPRLPRLCRWVPCCVAPTVIAVPQLHLARREHRVPPYRTYC